MEKQVSYALEADFQDLTKGIRDLMAGLKDVTNAFTQLGKKVDDALDGVVTETNKAAKGVKNMSAEITSAVRDVGLLAGAVTAVLVTGIKSATDTFAKFESTLNAFRAVSGATASDLERFKAVALELGSSTKFTAQEVAEAGVELAKMGFTAEESATALKGMVEASVASGESLQGTAEIVAATMRQFGMSADKAGEVGDIITKAANDSSISIQDWGQSMKYLGSAAAAADQPLTDMASLLVVLGNAGIKATVAGNGLQNALLRLQAPTEAAAGWMKQFNLQVEGKDGNMRNMIDIIVELQKKLSGFSKVKQAEILKDMFGEVALNSMQVFFNMTEEELRKAQAEMKNFQGTAQDTADVMRDGLGYSMMQLKASVEALKISFGEEFAPAIKAVANAIKTVVDAFNSMPQIMKTITANMILLTTAFTATFFGAAGLITAVLKSLEAFQKFTGMVTKNAGPALTKFGTNAKAVGLVVRSAVGSMLVIFGQLAAVAYVVHKAYKTNFGGLHDIISGFTDFLAADVMPKITGFTGDFNEQFAGLGQKFKGVWLGVTDTLITFVGFADQMTQDFFAMIGNISRAMRALAEKDWDWFNAEADNALERAKDMFKGIKSALTGDTAQVTRWRELAKAKFFANSADEAAVKTTKKRREAEQDLNKEFDRSADALDKKSKVNQKIQKEIKDIEEANEDWAASEKAKLESSEKNLDSLRKEFAAAAQAFAKDTDKVSKFQRDFQATVDAGGKSCAATVDAIGDLSQATVDFSRILSNSNSVYSYVDELEKLGLAFKITSREALEAGDILIYQDRVRQKGHAGVVTGPNKVVHSGSAAAKNKPGLHQFAAETSMDGGFYGRGGEVFGLRLTDKAFTGGKKDTKAAGEKIDLQEQVRIYQQLIGLRQRYAAVGIKNEALDEAIHSRSRELKNKKIDLIKAEKEAQEAALKDIQEAMQGSVDFFSESVDKSYEKAADILDAIASKANEAQQQIVTGDFSSSMSDFELITFITDQTLAISGLKSEVESYDQAIKELQKNEFLSPEQQQQLTEAQNKRAEAVGRAARAQKDLAAAVDLQGQAMGGADYEKAQEDFKALMDEMESSPEKARDFFYAIKTGAVDVDELKDKLGLSEEQVAEFLATIGTTEGIERFNKGIKDAEEAAEKLKKEFNEAGRNTAQIVGNISDGLRVVADRFRELNSEMSAGIDAVGEYMNNASGAISRVMSGDLFGGALQAGEGYLSLMEGVGTWIAKLMGYDPESVKNEQATIKEAIKLIKDTAIENAKEITGNLDAYRANISKQQDLDDAARAFLDSFVGDDATLREKLKDKAVFFASEQERITNEVLAAYSGDTQAAWPELRARLAEWSDTMGNEMGEAIVKAQNEVIDANKKTLETRLNEAEQKIKAQGQSMKDTLSRQHDYEAGKIEHLIELENRKLSRIQGQIDKQQELIDLKNKERSDALAEFDANDKGIFANLVKGVDYSSALAQGLKDAHNPDGVLTDTYSDKTKAEAIAERVALMNLENDNAYKLENITEEEYLKQQQNIAALQARAADEALKAEGLSNRQRLELEQTKANAYLDFQDAYRKALEKGFDDEIKGMETTLRKYNEKADVVQSTIRKHQTNLSNLAQTYQDKYTQIDDEITGAIDANKDFEWSVESLKNNLAGPLSQIVTMYKNIATAARQALSAGGSISGNDYTAESSTYRASYSPDGYNPYTSAPRMATGGVVPPGYEGDKFPAMLNSGEAVLPAWFTSMLKDTQLSMGRLGGGVSNSDNRQAVININGGNLSEVERVVMSVLKKNGSRPQVNGAWIMNTGLN